MPVALRPALDQDFDYCKRVYFNEMNWIIEELQLNRSAQETSFEQLWNVNQVQIIALGNVDIGWLQTITQDDGLFIGQMFVERPFQRKGIGTDVLAGLIREADLAHQTLRLSVAKINPAQRLYERMGFRIIHEDDRKFHMKRDPCRPASP